jgi:hypothetical protein
MPHVAVRFLVLSTFISMFAMLAVVGSAFAMTVQDVPRADLATPPASPAMGTAASPPAGISTPAISPSPSANPNLGNGAVSTGDSAAPAENSVTPETTPEASGEDETGDNPGSNVSGDADSGNPEPGPGNTPEVGTTSESPAPPPALDVASLPSGPELGSASLDGEIKQAVAPGLAASLRLTEEGRKQLADGQTDEAMRTLARAVSVDPGDAFAYYYLGRAHLQRKNYEQALTFFRRAEVGFSARRDWMAEALTYEGACDEELGRQADAIKAYQEALAASPNNLRARVGYGRLAPIAGPVGNLDVAPPEQDLSAPATDTQPESAPSESASPSTDAAPEDQ